MKCFLFCLFLTIFVPNKGQCFDQRIVNGTTAENNEFPFVVSLRYNNRHTCGASILSEFYILTAAHCVHGRSPKLFSIHYGSNHRGQDDFEPIQVDKVTEHPRYFPEISYENDIAVLKLKMPVSSFNDKVKAVKLPDSVIYDVSGKEAVLIGWGLSKTGGILFDELQKVNLKVFTNVECYEAYLFENPINESTNLCAGIPEGGKGQCSGDSGGPLTIDGVQIGIVSWSHKPCASPGYPGVFTRVSTYADWINQIIQNI